MSQFGERLREAFRGAKNVQIARALGVSEAAVRNYIEGRIPAAEMLALISEGTLCSIHWLITGEGAKFLAPTSPEDLADAVYKLIQQHHFNLEIFVVALAEMSPEFREMLNDLSYQRARKVKGIVEEVIELFEEEDELMHERLMETIRAQTEAKDQTTNFKTSSTEDERRIRESKPRSKRKKTKGE